jgi:hypothetical protein
MSVALFSGCSPSDNGNSSLFDNSFSQVTPKKNYDPPDDLPSEKSQKTQEALEMLWEGNTFPLDNGEEENFDLIAASENFFDSQIAECGGSCEEGVGLLLGSLLTRQAFKCTAFLVSSDIVMTASHCIPEDLKAPGSRAQGRLRIKFPMRHEENDVSYVIFASDISKSDRLSADYAVLKLTRPSFDQPLRVSRSGFPHDSSFRIAAMTPGAGGAVLTLTECHSLQNTPLFPEFRTDQSPLASLSDCQITEGNSGAPVFNDHGEVVGVLDEYLNLAKSPVGQIMKPEDIKAFPRVAVASSFSCIRDFNPQQPPLSQDCGEDLTYKTMALKFGKIYRDTLGQSTAAIDQEVQENINKWKAENSHIFKWKFVNPNLKLNVKEYDDHPSFLPQIDCVQPLEQWINDYKTFGFFYKSKASITGSLESFGAGVGADSQLQLHPQASHWTLGSYVVKFNPSEIKSKGEAHIILDEKMDILGKIIDVPIPLNIKMCQ